MSTSRRFVHLFSSALILTTIAFISTIIHIEDVQSQPAPSLSEDVRPQDPSDGSSGDPDVPRVQNPPICPIAEEADLYTADVSVGGLSNVGTSVSRGAPGCLRNLISQAESDCDALSLAESHEDNCVALAIALNGLGFTLEEARQFGGTENIINTIDIEASRSSGQIVVGSNGNGFRSNSYQFYFDPNCNAVREPGPDATFCRGMDVNWYCPVSLLWTENADVEKDSTFTQFPLQSGEKGMWYTWKASADAPLLVYDPQQSGKIESASQIFGHWTFSNRQTASIYRGGQSLSDTEPEGTKWENGYQALATLDQNHDQRVSGDELEPLGLWFDKNRDGVSQEGEVRQLKQVGVTALYYVPDSRDPVTNTLRVNVGYEREYAGKTIRGASVDWYGASARSPHELQTKVALKAALCSRSETSLTAVSEENEDVSDFAVSTKGPVDLSGAWVWQAKRNAEFKSKDIPRGRFFLNDQDGEISGHSVVEFGIPNKSNRLKSVVGMKHLKGQWKLGKDGTEAIYFKIREKNGSTVHSVARYSEASGILTGRSKVSMVIRGQSSVYSYDWVAQRASRR